MLRCVGPEFPDSAVTGFLRDAFQAELAGAGDIDLRGTASRHWADSPGPVQMEPGQFHSCAVRHPLVRAYRRIRRPDPLRLSDVVSPWRAPPPYGGTGISRVLAIPLTVGSRHICAVALLRGGADFTALDVQLARHLQPVISGIYALRERAGTVSLFSGKGTADAGVPLTARESAVLELIARGLIAPAIARRLGISPHTVGKHIESIYRKFGTHDRATTVLRGQALGLLPGDEDTAGGVPHQDVRDGEQRRPGREEQPAEQQREVQSHAAAQ
jgi:DNA-binding CsgD family transcriptional regulator